MHVTNYSVLYKALLEDFNVDEFNLIRKNKKKLKLLKSALGASYAMLASAVMFGSTEIGFTIIVAALILIFYFQAKIKRCLEIVSQDDESIENTIKNYINTEKLDSLRDVQFEKYRKSEISKSQFLEYIEDDVAIHYALVKKDCSKGVNIDIVSYKSSIEKLFSIMDKCIDENILVTEDTSYIEKRWVCDLQVLCNQYAKTDIEVDLKYLYLKSGVSK